MMHFSGDVTAHSFLKVSQLHGVLMVSEDLRESGAIEQNADLVILIDRPEVDDPRDHKLKGRLCIHLEHRAIEPVNELRHQDRVVMRWRRCIEHLPRCFIDDHVLRTNRNLRHISDTTCDRERIARLLPLFLFRVLGDLSEKVRDLYLVELRQRGEPFRSGDLQSRLPVRYRHRTRSYRLDNLILGKSGGFP